MSVEIVSAEHVSKWYGQVIGLVVLSISILERRVRGVEVVT